MRGRPSKILECQEWLLKHLSGGRRGADDVVAEADRQGFSKSTLDRAKADLNRGKSVIESVRINGLWYWRNTSVIDPQAVSEDKLDVLTNKVDELARIKSPVVPVVTTDASAYTGSRRFSPEAAKRAKLYDQNDPVNIALAERLKKDQEHLDSVKFVVDSEDPYALLRTCTLTEIEQMLTSARNHVMDLEAGYRCKVVRGTTLNNDGTKVIKAEVETRIPVEPAEASAGIAKWNSWIIAAKQRIKELEQVAEEEI